MFDISVSRAADTLVSQCSFFNCSYKEGWDNYIHPVITNQVLFEEVMNYINRKIELGKSFEYQ